MNNSPSDKKYRNAAHELKSYGFVRNLAVRNRPSVFVGIIVVFAITVGLLARTSPYGLNGAQLITAIITMGVFILGYQQWRAARNEISMDKFYDRLDLANRRLDAWPSARAMVSQLWQTELDGTDTYESVMYTINTWNWTIYST